MATFALPVAHWHEPPIPLTAPALSAYGWHYDSGADEYTITTNASLETHCLADVGGTGEYVLTPIGSLTAGIAILLVKQAGGGDINVY